MTLKPEHIVEELNRTPKLKRDLIMKMMEVMLDSEAFLEAYPTLYDPRIADVDLEYREKVCEEMAQIIVRLFRKNKVRPDDSNCDCTACRLCDCQNPISESADIFSFDLCFLFAFAAASTYAPSISGSDEYWMVGFS